MIGLQVCVWRRQAEGAWVKLTGPLSVFDAMHAEMSEREKSPVPEWEVASFPAGKDPNCG